jgi:cytochrome b561
MIFISTDERWGVVARALHWSMAALLFAQLTLGWVASGWRLSPIKLELFVWHKTLGVMLLALVCLRLVWRGIDRRPLTVGGPTWQHIAAKFTHAMLYLVMLAMPVIGWIIQSASGFPFRLFGLFPLPALVERSKPVQDLAESLHTGLAWIFVLLIVMHVGAAGYHHWVLGDNVLRRMIGRAGPREVQKESP